MVKFGDIINHFDEMNEDERIITLERLVNSYGYSMKPIVACAYGMPLEEKRDFRVVIEPNVNKIALIKAIREWDRTLSLADAKFKAEQYPGATFTDLDEYEKNALVDHFIDTGNRITISEYHIINGRHEIVHSKKINEGSTT